MSNGTTDTYGDMVARLFKPGKDIVETMTPERAQLVHAGMLATTEAGELLDAIKAQVIYNKPLDRENVIEEMGDLEFAMEAIRQLIDISRHDVIAANRAKLGKRYGTGSYSDTQATNRADKENGE